MGTLLSTCERVVRVPTRRRRRCCTQPLRRRCRAGFLSLDSFNSDTSPPSTPTGAYTVIYAISDTALNLTCRDSQARGEPLSRRRRYTLRSFFHPIRARQSDER